YCTLFSFSHPATSETYTLSLHDALPICPDRPARQGPGAERGQGHRPAPAPGDGQSGVPALRPAGRQVALGRVLRPDPGERLSGRSEEHTSELQSRRDLVCRLLLEKKKKR